MKTAKSRQKPQEARSPAGPLPRGRGNPNAGPGRTTLKGGGNGEPAKIPESLRSLLVPVERLTVDPKNARVHSERNLTEIAKSLEAFGQLKPIVHRGGQIIAGNGTFLAATTILRWPTVAAVDASTLTVAQARAYGIIDNRLAELSEWDFAALDDALREIDSELLSFTGFDDEELKDLLDLRQPPFAIVKIPIGELKPHPRNYQQHPEDQLRHIVRSIEINGFYRNVIVARDNTVLAGHGVVQAARAMGKKYVPVIRLDIGPDDPRAVKVMASDNEIGNLAETDDRALTELLKEVLAADGLDGTGFDEQQLAALAMVTRPSGEIPDFDAAAHWAGMPEYQSGQKPFRIIVLFDNEQDRAELLKLIGAKTVYNRGSVISLWWPDKPREDLKAVKLTDADSPAEN